ncbi:MAG TPA: TolC family protein [Geobacteraceae bacterium]|nr:TolC family protein [Geobacteraceae bacterium]
MFSVKAMLTTLLTLLVASGAGAEQLSLRDCLDQARQNNPSLKVATYDKAVAAADVNIAGSARLPRIDLQAGYTSQLEPQAVKIGPNSVQTQQADYAFAGVSIYQTLYDFGRTGSRREQASLLAKAVSSGYGNLDQEVALQVIRGFYAILQEEKLVQVAKDEVAQREQHLQVAKNLYDEGVTTRNDLLQAEVKLSGSRQKLLAARNTLNNSWLLLNYLTGNPGTYRATLEEDQFGNDSTAEDSTSPLPEGRHDIQAQRSIIRAGEASLNEIRSGFYPEIYLKAGIDYLQNDKVVEQSIIGATVGLKVNLYDGMATTARQRQAVDQLQRERERLRGLESAALLELQTARNDMAVARQRIEVTKDAIRQGEENLRINRDRYQAQVGTATDVVDAQTLLSQVKSDYYQALFDHQVARARVLRAAGEL